LKTCARDNSTATTRVGLDACPYLLDHVCMLNFNKFLLKFYPSPEEERRLENQGKILNIP
jgi:hypothetical protein